MRKMKISFGGAAGAALFLAISLSLGGPLRAADDFSATFPEEMWRSDLLVRLSVGPAILPETLVIDLPPPPGAVETRDELDRLELIYAEGRDERVRARIVIEAHADLIDLTRSYGLIPARGDAPELWALLEMTESETGWFVLREKRRYARARPTQVRPRLGTVLPVPGHPSYPSGHAAQIYAIAEVLGRLVPVCAPAYRRVAAGVAIRREIAGVHFPSDTRAGVLLADRVTDELLRTPQAAALALSSASALRSHAAIHGCVGSDRVMMGVRG